MIELNTDKLLKFCWGIKDCDPPPTERRFLTPIFAFLLFMGSDMVFYNYVVGEDFSDPFARAMPDMVMLSLGILLASILFTEIYIYYARSPRGWETKDDYRSRTQKGTIYGLIMGVALFVPAIFIDQSLYDGVNLGNHIIDGIYHIIQMTVAGVFVSHLLGSPAREKPEQ